MAAHHRLRKTLLQQSISEETPCPLLYTHSLTHNHTLKRGGPHLPLLNKAAVNVYNFNERIKQNYPLGENTMRVNHENS